MEKDSGRYRYEPYPPLKQNNGNTNTLTRKNPKKEPNISEPTSCCKCNCFRKSKSTKKSPTSNFIQGCVTNLGICLLLFVYTLIGSFIFLAIEGGNNVEQHTLAAISNHELKKAANSNHEIKNAGISNHEINQNFNNSNFSQTNFEFRTKTIENLWTMTENLNILYKENWTRLAAQEITKFQEQIINRIAEELRSQHSTTQHSNSIQIQDDQADRSEYDWTFAKAFLYSLTVLTTIGYGQIAPRSTLGKSITIIYALIGIPLTLLYLSSIGSLLSHIARKFFSRALCCCLCSNCGYCCYDEKRMLEKERKMKRKRQQLELQQQLGLTEGTRQVSEVRKDFADTADPRNYPESARNFVDSSGTFLEPYYVRSGTATNLTSVASNIGNVQTCPNNLQSSFQSNLQSNLQNLNFQANTLDPNDLRQSPSKNSNVRDMNNPSFNSFNPNELRSGSYSTNFNPNSTNPNTYTHNTLQSPNKDLKEMQLKELRDRDFNFKELQNYKDLKEFHDKNLSNTDLKSLKSDSSIHGWSIFAPILLCLIIMFAYICVGAIILYRLENWSLLNGFYFCFMSLSTIGFGDMIPGISPNEKMSNFENRRHFSRSGLKTASPAGAAISLEGSNLQASVKKPGFFNSGKADFSTPQNSDSEFTIWFCSFYIMFGMSLTAMCFSVIHDEIIHRLKHQKSIDKKKCLDSSNFQDIHDSYNLNL